MQRSKKPADNVCITLNDGDVGSSPADELDAPLNGQPQYRVYKRRFFGLIQLVLLNIVVSWDVSNHLPDYLPCLYPSLELFASTLIDRNDL